MLLAINVSIACFCFSFVLNTSMIGIGGLPICWSITGQLMQCSKESSSRQPSLQFRLVLFMEVKHILKLLTVFALTLKRVDDSVNEKD